MNFVILTVALLTPAFLAPFEHQSSPGSQDATPVRVPSFPNASCPIMGKPISLKLFTDTDRGRIWVCCKGCIADIRADVALAYKTAYPTERAVESAVCPVTGKQLPKEAPEVTLQGMRFRVFDATAAKSAVTASQLTLTRLMEPTLVDVGNATCPVDGQPVVPNAFAVVEGHIVRLSSTQHVEAITKNPNVDVGRSNASSLRSFW